jgi:threonine/homoserine/homoserine lactone efflux protein
MDYVLLAFSGVLIGVFVAAPIGPVNLICIRRTLAFGPLNGFMSGLGAAVGDTVFAIVTSFGLTAVAQLIEGFASYIELVGGVLLIYFGYHTYVAKVEARLADKLAAKEKGARSLYRAMVSTFALTITNPATLFGFAVFFAGLGGLAGGHPSLANASIVVLGVAVGSTLWWLALTALVGLFHATITDRTMHIINRVSGTVIAGFGVVVLVHLAVKFL